MPRTIFRSPTPFVRRTPPIASIAHGSRGLDLEICSQMAAVHRTVKLEAVGAELLPATRNANLVCFAPSSRASIVSSHCINHSTIFSQWQYKNRSKKIDPCTKKKPFTTEEDKIIITTKWSVLPGTRLLQRNLPARRIKFVLDS
jgi:hypothetical protein